jgi:hypothetical protein
VDHLPAGALAGLLLQLLQGGTHAAAWACALWLVDVGVPAKVSEIGRNVGIVGQRGVRLWDALCSQGVDIAEYTSVHLARNNAVVFSGELEKVQDVVGVKVDLVAGHFLGRAAGPRVVCGGGGWGGGGKAGRESIK